MIALGLDIGTTTIALVALDLESGMVLWARSLPNERLPDGGDASYLQDAETIRAKAEELLGGAGEAASLGIAGQMHGLLYFDRHDRPASPLYTWLDARAAAPVGGIVPIEEPMRRLGRSLPAGYALATHYALRLAQAVPPSALRIGGICEYIAEGLVGARLGASDASCLASYGAWDVAASGFDTELLEELLGPDAPAYLRLAPPMSVAGLWKGTLPVAYPVGDNQAGFHGLVADPQSTCLVNLGTSGQLSFFTPRPRTVAGMDLRPFLGRGYLQVGASLCGGKAWEIAEEFLRAAAELVTGQKIESASVYAAMDRLASGAGSALAGTGASGPGGSGLRVIPSFGGTRADPAARGAILGIGMDNLKPATFVAALIRGVVEELRGFSLGLGSEFDRISLMLATGGFALKVPAVARALAESFSLSVSTCAVGDGAAIGAALIGAQAAGLIDADTASHIVSLQTDGRES